MSLYSLFIEHEGKSFSTQFVAESANEAVLLFFAHPLVASTNPVLSAKDILYVTPMEGMVNLWAACAGRDGKYVSITCTRTVARQGA
jgi:hypothetical protein